jgi:hypothetical protein
VNECEWDFSSSTPPDTIFRVTKERWAQIGITTEFLILVMFDAASHRPKPDKRTNEKPGEYRWQSGE